MDLKTRMSGNVAIAEMNGRFDALEVPKVSAWLDTVTDREDSRIVVNMTGVTFVDSTALSLLVKGMKRARQHNGDLTLCGLQKPVKVIFELTRLDKAFNMYEDEGDALHALL
ncbi:MAG: STAS domain-containing protein [Anaerolineae bacterium]|nr:STAS domain-containing protein [Anaerolineae bacterium]MBN8619359.1 STAS domain-containing protein [Anaerolineae bacterium]